MALKLDRTSAYSSSIQGAHSEPSCSMMAVRFHNFGMALMAAVRRREGAITIADFPTHVLIIHQSYASASW